MSVLLPCFGWVCDCCCGGGAVVMVVAAALVVVERERGFGEDLRREWNGRERFEGKRGMGEKIEEEWSGSLWKWVME